MDYIGGALIFYGFLLSIWEKHNDLELYYVHGKDWGSAGVRVMNNSGFIQAVGVTAMASSMNRGLCREPPVMIVMFEGSKPVVARL